MKNVLFILYYFPPMGGSGVQRPLKFAKYLRDYGWNPIILCPEPGIYHTFDESLEKELDALDLEIHRVKNADIFQKAATHNRKKIVVSNRKAKLLRRISRLFFYPDNKRGWIKPAISKALEIISENSIDAIFSSAPPFSNHIIGQQIKEATDIPLVVDYRDSWSRNHFQENLWGWQKNILRNQETKIIASTDKIICLDNFIKENFIKDYPESKSKVSVIPHGFDAEDFDKKTSSPILKYKDKKLNFLYSGLFYEQNQPDLFLSAIHNLVCNDDKLKDIIHLHFQGGVDHRIQELINSYGLEYCVTDYGYVPHSVAVENLIKADVLWMISNFDPNLKQIKSGKLYEYIGTKKPILGLVHESEASLLLEKYGSGFWAPPTSELKIRQIILEIINVWKRDNFSPVDETFVNKFNRKKLAEHLSSIFNTITT
jgi:glycosyltransferase involved in cell wall biosynthesis